MNGNDFIFVERFYDITGIDLYNYKLNNIELGIDPNYWTLIPEGLHFSQDGKYLMFTTKVSQMKPYIWDPFALTPYRPKDTIPYAQKRFLETFIVDIDKTISSGKMVLHKIIRYRRNLCYTGVFWNAQFLTPTSYVISYRYNNSELSQLHEISID